MDELLQGRSKTKKSVEVNILIINKDGPKLQKKLDFARILPTFSKILRGGG